MSPIDYRNYPPNWKAIRTAILERAENRCEGSPAYPDCRAENHQPHPMTGAKVVLTVAHLDHDITRNDFSNLRALCQLCHNTYDQHHRRRKDAEIEYPYWWRVRARLPQYYKFPCAVTARGSMNSCRVVFPDGHIVITSRNYIRKRT